jgi:low affinity Fe/Cu permease
MFGGMSRYVGWFIIAVIAVAIWRGSNGDLTKVADTVWMVLNKGADFVTVLWNNLTASSGK